jgi:hypothetical protein
VSALFDRDHPPRRHPHGADDDTAELPVPAADTTHDRDHADHPPVDHDRGRLRPTTRARRLQASLLLGAYAPASLGSAWLLVLAFLRLSLPVMVLLCGALVWLVPDTVRLARWLARVDHGAQRPRLPRSQRLVAGLLAVVYAYLLVDWLLHQ